MEEKKGNPYHAKDGKFTSKSGEGSKEVKNPKIENVSKIIDDFFKGLKNKGLNLDKKEPKEKSSDLDTRIDEEIADLKSTRENFDWIETDVDIAHEVADKLEIEGFGNSEELFDKIMDKLEATDEEDEETKKWKLAGFKEKMVDVSDLVSSRDFEYGDQSRSVDLSDFSENLGEDLGEFLEQNSIALTEEEKSDLIQEGVIPERIAEEFDSESFSDFLFEKYKNEIEEQIDDEESYYVPDPHYM